LPQTVTPYTDLLNLAPVPVASLHNPAYEALYTRFTHFNPIQTQVFHDLYHSDRNVLVGAPTGSGKTVVAELATFRAFNAHPGSKVVYIAPLKALVSERIKDWRAKFGPMRKEVVELTGDVTPDLASLHRADIIITTPEKWDGISRSWQRRDYVRRVSLVVIDEIHLLGEERGPVLEVIVSRMRYIATRTARAIRFLGLSTALANAADLGDWLGVPPGSLYNFRPSVRPVPMEVHIQGFPGKAYCPRMATMNKPTYAAITTYAPDHPALVFVASRRQTRLTALEMIALCATDERPKRFLAMEEAALELLLVGVKDEALRHTLTFGVGIHHAGLCESDRTLVEDLFVNMKIRVLVCTSTLAWGVNFPARLVVIKGTEFFDAKTSRYVDFPITDVLQMMGRAGRPQFNETGVAVILVHEPKKKFYQKFLYEPFPVESQLRGALVDHINAEVSGGSIICRNDALEYLTWTYFFRRLLQNPGYYSLEDTSPAGVKEYLLALVDEVFTKLEDAGCVARSERAVEALTAERVAEATAAASKHAARHGRRAGAGRVDMESYMDAVLPPVEVDPEDTDALAVLSVVPPAAEAVAATPLGRVASFYYLFHTSMHLFATRLAPDMGTVKLARLLCASDEFAGLPVRHNEEEVNLRLAMELPWPREGLTYTSPHTKAFLLLQARLARAVLPMSDYISDTKGVLDQSVRVGHCMVDVAAELNMYAVTLRLIQLVQCIVMAVLPSKPAAAHLRGATDAAVATCLRLMGGDTQANRTSLAALQAKREADVLHALRSGDDALPPQQAAALVDH
ncbi:DEAD/DEAH box helicase, partial [archaeon]